MRLLDFVVCDDIRFEVANKISLIGVYNDAMSFMAQPSGVAISWPAVVRLGIYARLLSEKDEAAPNRFLMNISHEDNMLARIEGELKIQDLLKPFQLALHLAQLPIPGPGYLTFRLLLQRDSELVKEMVLGPPFAINCP